MAEIVWLASYPKSGNTWTRALLAAYFGEGAFDLNNLGSGIRLGGIRSLDDLIGVDPSHLRLDEVLAYRPRAARVLARDVANEEGPLFSKIHSANHPTPSGERVFPSDVGRALYVVRNPLDVVTSAAPFFDWTLDQAVEVLGDEGFILNHRPGRFAKIIPEPLLTWSNHVRSWLDAPGLSAHVLRYEDLQADPAAAFTGALRFVGVEPDGDRVAAAVETARFDRLREREAEEGFREHPRMATAPFFRKGKTGTWREELSPAQARRVVADHRETMLRLGYADAVAEVEGR